jgi:hypothetical protein
VPRIQSYNALTRFTGLGEDNPLVTMPLETSHLLALPRLHKIEKPFDPGFDSHSISFSSQLENGHIKTDNIRLERFARVRYSSLLGKIMSYEENEVL